MNQLTVRAVPIEADADVDAMRTLGWSLHRMVHASPGATEVDRQVRTLLGANPIGGKGSPLRGCVRVGHGAVAPVLSDGSCRQRTLKVPETAGAL